MYYLCPREKHIIWRMKFIYNIYQVCIALPIFLVLTLLTALTTIIGSLIGGAHVWGYYPGKIWSKKAVRRFLYRATSFRSSTRSRQSKRKARIADCGICDGRKVLVRYSIASLNASTLSVFLFHIEKSFMELLWRGLTTSTSYPQSEKN